MVKSSCIAILEATTYLENLFQGQESLVIRRTSSVENSYRFKNDLLTAKDNFLEQRSFEQLLERLNDNVNIFHVVITS